jgi:hypothetical protein
MRRIVLLTAWLAIICAAVGGTVAYLAIQAENRKEYQDFKKAQQLLAAGEPHQALDIIEVYGSQLSAATPKELDWLPLTVDALAQTQDANNLLALYPSFPRGFDKNEEAVLLVASGLLAQRKLDDYHILKDKWADRATKEPEWFNLDADALIVEGKQEEALAHLNSKEFEGPQDTGRLVRLSLIHARDNLAESWNTLNKALAKDPKNTDVTTYRAQILEAIHKPALARIEYLSAIQKDPNNADLVYQLGEFYRRNNHYPLAIDTWRQGLPLANSNELWLKALFWSRMTSPMNPEPTVEPPKTGELAPLISYIYHLPKGMFWDDALFEKVPDNSRYLRTRQETFWLRLSQALMDDDEAHAAELLDFNTFHASSWSPNLQNALQQILAYRRYGILHIDEVASSQNLIDKEEVDPGQGPVVHQFFKALKTLAAASPAGLPAENVPDDMRSLLTSKYAFPSALLAAGWLEAALVWPLPAALPKDFPEWVAFAYTQALRYNRSPLEALNFATKQKASPPLSLLIGELMIATGSPDAGLEQLQPLAKLKSDIGTRSAWLISLIEIERKQYDKARKTIQSHPLLAKNLIGKEAMARIALKQGNIAQADELYGALEKDSLEAKFYLARRAYAEKQWDRALKLTEQLIVEFPDNPELHKDLQKLRELKAKDSP